MFKKLEKAEMDALKKSVKPAALNRAQMVNYFPQLATMSQEQLNSMRLDADAVKLAAGMAAEAAEKAAMHGISENHTLQGWHVVAKKGIERFYAQLAPLDAFSTTFKEDYIIPGAPNAHPEVEVALYDDSGEAEVDNFDNFDERDSAASSSATLHLHKVDDVITIYARNIEQGINMEEQVAALISRVAKKVQKYVLSQIAVGTAQADDATKKVAALDIPAIGNENGQFNFGYANQTLSEAIQPRVHAMLLDSAHYGALKAANQESLTAKDLDVDGVWKIQDTDALGTGVVGAIVNKRAVAVGLAAPYFFTGAYESVQQMQHQGQGAPLTIATYFIPGLNAFKVVAATYVGATVTDASAIKPLIEAEDEESA